LERTGMACLASREFAPLCPSASRLNIASRVTAAAQPESGSPIRNSDVYQPVPAVSIGKTLTASHQHVAASSLSDFLRRFNCFYSIRKKSAAPGSFKLTSNAQGVFGQNRPAPRVDHNQQPKPINIFNSWSAREAFDRWRPDNGGEV
jgi:hypothetical protein